MQIKELDEMNLTKKGIWKNIANQQSYALSKIWPKKIGPKTMPRHHGPGRSNIESTYGGCWTSMGYLSIAHSVPSPRGYFYFLVPAISQAVPVLEKGRLKGPLTARSKFLRCKVRFSRVPHSLTTLSLPVSPLPHSLAGHLRVFKRAGRGTLTAKFSLW